MAVVGLRGCNRMAAEYGGCEWQRCIPSDLILVRCSKHNRTTMACICVASSCLCLCAE